MPHFFATVAVLLGLALLPARAFAAGQTAPVQIRPENTLTQGALPNGLRYVILPHDSPKGDIALRLIVRAGSLDEHDDERGFAHFVEHMAFNGTRNFPPGTVRLFFETLGLQFGADLNAQTSYTHTQYLLDLPTERADRTEEALILLRDYADGQLFLPEEVAQEAKVVISELKVRDTAGQRTALERQKILHAGSRVAQREIGGVAEQIERATADQLRAFYRRNYAPDRMTLLIVGRVDAASLLPKITTIFSGLTAAGEHVAPYAAGRSAPSEGIRPAVIEVPTMTTTALTEFDFLSSRAPDTVEGRRQDFVQRIAVAILERRLETRREREKDKFSPPKVSSGSTSGDSAWVRHQVAVSTVVGDWSAAVQLIETELRRGREGFTPAEISEAVAVELAALQNRIASSAGQSASSLIGSVAGSIVAEREWQPPAARFSEAQAALTALAPAEVAAAFARIFPQDSFRIILSVPPERSVKTERIVAAYHKSAGRTLKTKTTEEKELQFLYANTGTPGAIVKRERVEDLDLSLVSFANGVRLNVRPSAFEPEQFRLRIVFPQNLSNVPTDLPGIADLAGFLLLNSNLKKHKQSELTRLLRLHGIKPGFTVNTGTPTLTLAGPAEELPFALQFLTALLSDLEFDDEYYKVALGYYSGLFKGTNNSAGGLGMREALRIFSGDDPRPLLINPKVFANQDGLKLTEKWLRNHILTGPLEVGLIGDFTADEAIATAAATLGTLKDRKAPPKPGALLALPKKASRQETVAAIGAGTAFSCALWAVELPDDPKHNAALALAAAVLHDRLLLVLRETFGATYSPHTPVHRDIVQRDFAYVGMINTFDPPSARKFTEGSIKLAARLAEKGLSVAEFERQREPLRSRYGEDLRSNGWWLNEVVSRAQSHPEVLVEARQHEKIFDAVTLEDANQAAQVFKSDRVTVVIVQPKPASETTGATPKKK